VWNVSFICCTLFFFSGLGRSLLGVVWDHSRRQSLLRRPTLLLAYLLMYGAEPFLRSCQLCSHSGKSQQF
jgi:hypothetical protein